MGSSLSRSVEIQISNNTQDITLKDPRTYFGLGHCSKPPLPALFPRTSDTCHVSGDMLTGGLSGVLVYESESFTLAIHFSNPVSYNTFSRELSLELSPGKSHPDDLGTTYTRMSKGTYSSSGQDIKFARIILGKNHKTVQVSYGPVVVMATMSSERRSTLKVVLEEQRGSGDEAEGEDPCPGRQVQQK